MEIVNLAPYPVPKAQSYFDTTFFGDEVDPYTSRMDQSVQFRAKFNLVNDLEEKYGKLLTWRTALEQEQKLTTNIALECDLIMGNTEMGNLCFCDERRQKKYEMAMEAINLGLAAILAALAAALVGFIAYVISVFRGQNHDSDNVTPDTVASKKALVEEASTEFATLSSETQRAIDVVLKESKSGKVKRRSTKAKPAIAQEREGDGISDQVGYVKPLTPMQMDNLSTGEYTKLMQEVLKVVDQSHPVKVLEDARQAYRELVTATHHGEPSPSDSVDHDTHVDGLKNHYMQLMADPRRVHRLLMEQINKLIGKQRNLDAGNVQFPESVSAALKMFSTAVTSAEIGNYARTRTELVPVLDKLRQEAQTSQAAFDAEHKKAENDKGLAPKGIAEHGKEVLKEMHGLLAVVLKTDLMFQRYWKSLDTCAYYLHWVVSTTRWNLGLELHDKGQNKFEIAQQPDIKHMDKVIAALEAFRKKVR